MRRLSISASSFCIGVLCLIAQTADPQEKPDVSSAALPGGAKAFEVASIKPLPPYTSVHWGLRYLPGGRVEADGITVKEVIAAAFHVPQTSIQGGPAWLDSDVYAISAVPPETPLSHRTVEAFFPTKDESAMLQGLLAERFALRVHRQSTQTLTYLLSKGRAPLKLTSPADTVRPPAFVLFMRGNLFDGEARGANVTLHAVAEQLTSDLGVPVIDATGLAGAYDFYVAAFTPENDDAAVAAVGAMHRIGLDLKKGRGSIEKIIVDSVQKPTPN